MQEVGPLLVVYSGCQNGDTKNIGIFLIGVLEIKKCPIILDAKENIARLYLEHAHRICAHQAMEQVKALVQQSFDTQNIQPIMALLPAFRFRTEETKFPLANTGLAFLDLFILKTNKAESRKFMDLFLHASLREQSIWKHVRI